MSIENDVAGRGPVRAATRLTLIAALLIAVVITASTAISSTVSVIGDLTAGRLATTLVADVPAPTTGGDLVSAIYSSADVVVRGVPVGIVALVGGAAFAGVLARLLLGTALVVMLLAVRRRAPFSASSALIVTVVGGVATIAAVLQIGTGVLGDWMLADHLTSAGLGDWPTAATSDPTLIAVGFGVMVVGLFLSHGAELQRETEGLV